MSNSTMNHKLIALIVCVATIGGFMFGYDSGAINGTQHGLESAFNLAALGTGLTVGAILVGSAIGAFLAGRLADQLGRVAVMRIAALLFIASALISGAASNAVIFIAARIVGGLGIGAASVLAPVYISEMVPAHVRGRLSSVQQIMIISGLTGAFLVNFLLAKIAGSSTSLFWFDQPTWRWMFWAQVIPAAAYLLTLMLIPESPRFLIMKGRVADGQQVLTELFGAQEALRKVADIGNSLAADHRRPKLSDLLGADGRVRTIVWAGVGLAVFQQLVGINIVFYYGSVLWQAVGFSENDALLINIVTGTLSIVGCILTLFFIDHIGRKPLLLIGSLGMAVALGTMAFMFANGALASGVLSLAGQDGIVALIAANLYVVFFNMSWGPVMWVMLGEMFPNQMRGTALAVSGFAQWIANFAITVTFPMLVHTAGLSVTYGFYTLAAIVSFLFVYTMVSETRGRELEDMAG